METLVLKIWSVHSKSTALKADQCFIIPTSDEVSSEFNGGAEGSS